MTDNMTDITLKKEKIQELRDKRLRYLTLLDEWTKSSVPVEEVKRWINELVSPILPEFAINGLKSVPRVNGVGNHQKHCESESESDIDSTQTKTSNADIELNITDFNDNHNKDSDSSELSDTEEIGDLSREISTEVDSGFDVHKSLDSNSVNNETDPKDNKINKSDSKVSEELNKTETGSKESEIENKDFNWNNRFDSIGSELSSEDSDNKNSDKSMSGSVRTRLRNKCDKKVSQSSDSSEAEFDDSSDTPKSGTDSDSDFKVKVNGKSGRGSSSHQLSKYEKLSKDFRLNYTPFVELINLDEDIINSAAYDTETVSNTINEFETKLFDSLNSKGVICRKMKANKQKESKPKNNVNGDDSDSDKELKRLCRIPKIRRIAKNGSKSEKNNKDSNKFSDSESSVSDKKPKKKVKTSTPLKEHTAQKGDITDSDLESDCDISNVNTSKANSIHIKTKKEVKLDALDSDVSSDDQINNEKTKTRTKKPKKESDSEADNESDDEKDKKDIKKLSSRPTRGVKEENESKSVIDLDSDEDIGPKKRVAKRRVSDDDDYSDKSSVIESSDGMDPSTQDSDSDSGSESDNSEKKSKKNKKSKKSKKKDRKDKKGKRKRVRVHNSSDEDDCKVLSDENDSPNKSRKLIRKIISDKKIKQQTKDAAESERDRVRRIKEKQKEYNDLIKTRSLLSADVKELILEFDNESKEPYVEVDKTLVKFLKPHQKNGIEFMYNCAIETVEQLSKDSEGSGCILAHSMGLGKTLQVVTFLYTILTHKDIKKHIKRALVICPVNTIKNWANEFRLWLVDNDLDDLLVFEMFDAKTPLQRADLLNIWHKRGGVMIIGLTLFSSLVVGGRGKKPAKSVRDAIQKCLLDPGADVVICDEGHLLKNEKTAYNKAVSQIKTLRRIVLTGTPLQNNLLEYHVMVHFVKPNLLGNKKEFTNRFVNPITNGQHEDSTDYDVKIMKKRVHILHTLLNGCVHRCDYNVLVPYLQPKQEYVISVMLTEKQIELYEFYLKNICDRQKLSLLADYGSLRLIWNHPILLYEQHRRRIEKANEESMDEFIDDDEDAETPPSCDSDVELIDNKAGPSMAVPKRRMRTRGTKEEEMSEEEEEEKKSLGSDDAMSDAWFAPLLKRDETNQIELSGKFILLFSILEECEKLGDKILLFSQSLDTLDLVEEMLKLRMERAAEESRNIPEIDLESGLLNDATNVWVKNRDYFRLDGSTASDYRKAWIDVFNDENNFRARLFLISTKAGGLGINLVGANRCIIFDASWNPTHDVQAIFRIFRFGQKKPVYVYRFVAQGSMEEKIYERQIIKQSLSCRVVDEQSIQRHFKSGEVSELYKFNPDKNKNRPTPILPKDKLLAELLKNQKEFIVKYHEHDSLLENRPDEEMTEEEKMAAWNEYENEKDALFLREQQERDAQMQREALMNQMQAQQQQQQNYQQQQQQQYIQQLYQQMQSNGQFAGVAPNDYQSMLTNTLYQSIMRQQAEIRKQQQQKYNEAKQQRLAELARMAGNSGQQSTSNSNSGALPGYDRMTVEDIAKYLKSINTQIDNSQLVQRIFGILDTGLSTCTKELTLAKQALTTQNTPELRGKYEKLAKEVFNLNRQKQRAQTVLNMRANLPRAGSSILRDNLASNPPTVEELDDDMEASTSTRPSDQLIEEVD